MRKPLRSLLLLAVGWLTSATVAVAQQPAGLPQNAVPSANISQEIEALVARQTALLIQSDANGLASLFTQDALYVNAAGESFSGPQNIGNFYAQTFAKLDYARQASMIGDYSRESKVLLTQGIGEEAWAFGRGRLLVNGPAGVVSRTDHWTAIYAKQGGQWKIRLMSVGEDVQPCDCDGMSYRRRQ